MCGAAKRSISGSSSEERVLSAARLGVRNTKKAGPLGEWTGREREGRKEGCVSAFRRSAHRDSRRGRKRRWLIGVGAAGEVDDARADQAEDQAEQNLRAERLQRHHRRVQELDQNARANRAG